MPAVDSGDQHILLLVWNTPFSGNNSAYCFVVSIRGYNAASWDTIQEHAERGKDNSYIDTGAVRVRFMVGQDASPILRVIASRKKFF